MKEDASVEWAGAWNLHAEDDALAVFTFHFDPAAERLRHQVVQNMQSESGAAMVAFGGEKGLEDMLKIFLGNSFAIVTVR